jgi:hypothetical protein
VARIGVPAVTAGIGIAGGILLGRTALHRERRVLGIPIPSKVDLNLNGLTEQIGEAGRQFGKLAGEVRTVAGEVRNVKEKAEQVGRILG